jgi:hypothetical protein
MRSQLVIAVALIAGSAAAPAAAQYYGGDGDRDQIIRCESNDGRTRECPTGGGRVLLERQISRAPCIEGRSWGYGRGSVWVAQGCRADFRLSGWGGQRPDWDDRHGQGYGNIVRCDSNDGGVLERQLSRAACIEGRSWGSDRGSVWVSQGCRGEFAVRRGGGWNRPDYGYGGRVFRCESNDGRYVECAASTRAGIQLVRQLSRAPCIEGRSWGYGRAGIWVAQGCRAEFRSF